MISRILRANSAVYVIPANRIEISQSSVSPCCDINCRSGDAQCVNRLRVVVHPGHSNPCFSLSAVSPLRSAPVTARLGYRSKALSHGPRVRRSDREWQCMLPTRMSGGRRVAGVEAARGIPPVFVLATCCLSLNVMIR